MVLVLMMGIALIGGAFSLSLIGKVLGSGLEPLEGRSEKLRPIEGVAKKEVQPEPQEEEIVDSSFRDRLRSALTQDWSEPDGEAAMRKDSER